MYSQERANQISGGVFVIGLGLMFLRVLPWWPGIMFVIGASSIAKGLAQGKNWAAMQGGIWMIVIGLVFGLGWLGSIAWPLILIAIGASMLFGWNWFKPGNHLSRRERREREMYQNYDYDPQMEKRKNDQMLRDEELAPLSDTDKDAYRLGDDGELVKVKKDQQ